MEPIEDPPLVAQLRSLLDRSTRIEITDGRVFVGQFMCIDNSKNIILASAYESRPQASASAAGQGQQAPAVGNGTGTEAGTGVGAGGQLQGAPTPTPSVRKMKEEEKRFVGQIMIPGNHIVKVEIDCSHRRGADVQLKAPGKYSLDHMR